MENYYLTLKYDNIQVSKVTEKLMRGRVETAHTLEIATFPIKFKHPEKRKILDQLEEENVD